MALNVVGFVLCAISLSILLLLLLFVSLYSYVSHFGCFQITHSYRQQERSFKTSTVNRDETVYIVLIHILVFCCLWLFGCFNITQYMKGAKDGHGKRPKIEACSVYSINHLELIQLCSIRYTYVNIYTDPYIEVRASVGKLTDKEIRRNQLDYKGQPPRCTAQGVYFWLT